ncbi:MAG: asparagine synthetase B, partial [Thermoleophilia bacterium]|nr:asparagine synthetase B [Thermoleophilia bacterium]
MCGICGILGVESSGESLGAMLGTIVHRGPDAEGRLERPGTALGMRRLAIIDLVGGDQPIFNEDGTVATVFNGEIYNFVELRDELIREGHRFTTRSDTEVL